MDPKQYTGENFFRLTRFTERTPRSGFGPASREEKIVFGARMPGYGARSIPAGVVERWMSLIEMEEIKRVCCLLPQSQLGYYDQDLLKQYRNRFGIQSVHWAPIEDYHLCDAARLAQIILFLKQSDIGGEKVVVHCAGGRGRTGFVLAAWLIKGRGSSIEQALNAVKEMGRNPYEAVECGHATVEGLYALLGSY